MIDLNTLLRMNIEIEGLLRVMADRPSSLVREMIIERFDEYSMALNSYITLTEPEAPCPEFEKAEAPLWEPEQAEAPVCEPEQPEAPVCEPEQTEAPVVEEEEECPLQDYQEYVAPEIAGEYQQPDEIIEFGQSVDFTEPETVPEPEPTPEPEVITEPEEMPAPEIAPEPSRGVSKVVELKRCFTLNDRYRFIRELFNNDAEDFEQTLAILAECPNYEDVCDYLYNDLLWDAGRPEVVDFMAIVEQQFMR